MLLLVVLLANAAILSSGRAGKGAKVVKTAQNLTDDSSFDKFVKDHDRALILFMSDPCPVCKLVEAHFRTLETAGCNKLEDAKNAIAGNLEWCRKGSRNETRLAYVHAGEDDWKGAAKRFELEGFPSVLYYHKGELTKKYLGLRRFTNDTIALLKWIKKREWWPHELPSYVRAPGTSDGQLAIVATVQNKSARHQAFLKAMDTLSNYDAFEIKAAVKFLDKDKDPRPIHSYCTFVITSGKRNHQRTLMKVGRPVPNSNTVEFGLLER